MTQPKHPHACTSLGDIREGIDFHDRQIFEALVRRLQYVKAAAQFKANEQDIPAPDRVAAMLQERLAWAGEANLDPVFIKALFETIIHWNIQQQIEHWRETRAPVAG